jgi:ribonuclease PH
VTLALIDAGIPMQDFVVACAASFVEGVTLNDPNYIEDMVGGPNLPLALMPKTGKVRVLESRVRVTPHPTHWGQHSSMLSSTDALTALMYAGRVAADG